LAIKRNRRETKMSKDEFDFWPFVHRVVHKDLGPLFGSRLKNGLALP